MGSAMAQGWVDHGVNKKNIYVSDPFLELDFFGRTGFVNYTKRIHEIEKVDFCVLAIKPQQFSEILTELRNLTKQNVTFISIAAGKTIKSISDTLGKNAKIVRVMPNLPATIGKGVSCYISGEGINQQIESKIEHLLKANGKVIKIEDESLMDVVTAISGSGPAYIFHLIECIEKIAINKGLTPEEAKIIATQTVYGSASLASASENDARILRHNVTSKGGTTEAALEVLMNGDNNMEKLFEHAIEAAILRGKNLQ